MNVFYTCFKVGYNLQTGNFIQYVCIKLTFEISLRRALIEFGYTFISLIMNNAARISEPAECHSNMTVKNHHDDGAIEIQKIQL